jgi:transposase-like protein
MALSNYYFVHPSAFCWNPKCSEYGKVKQGNVRRFGRTQAGTQRYQCKTCKHTFVETIGTVFYGRHHSQQTILECLALVAERNSLAAIHRVKGVKEETVLGWLLIAASHVERIEALLLANYRLSRAQLDAMWTYVGNKGEKGATKKPTRVAPSGEASSSTLTRGYALGGL